MRPLTLILLISTMVFIGISMFFILGYSEKKGTQKIEIKKLKIPLSLQKTVGEYEEYINESLCKSGTPGAAVVIVKGEDIIYLQGFGVRDKDTGEIVDIHTVFRLASVSKCFTAALAGTLVEDSLFSWDDPVAQHWTSFSLKSPDQTNQLKIKNLLSHTTGFPYHAYTNLIEEGRSLLSLVSKLTKLDLVTPVGTQYSYQNVAFSIIDGVIESSTGKSFKKNMKEKLIEPLHLSDMSMSYEDLCNNDNVALPHVRSRKTWKRVSLSPTYYNVTPAGGVNASITDMGKWLQAMLGNAGNTISPGTIKKLITPVIVAEPKNKNFGLWHKIKKSYYGLGWRVLCFENDTIAYHGGYVRGYRSEVMLYPKEKLGICVLANGAGRFSNRAIPKFLSIYDKYNSRRVAASDKNYISAVYREAHLANGVKKINKEKKIALSQEKSVNIIVLDKYSFSTTAL